MEKKNLLDVFGTGTLITLGESISDRFVGLQFDERINPDTLPEGFVLYEIEDSSGSATYHSEVRIVRNTNDKFFASLVGRNVIPNFDEMCGKKITLSDIRVIGKLVVEDSDIKIHFLDQDLKQVQKLQFLKYVNSLSEHLKSLFGTAIDVDTDDDDTTEDDLTTEDIINIMRENGLSMVVQDVDEDGRVIGEREISPEEALEFFNEHGVE